MDNTKIQAIVSHFAIDGTLAELAPVGNGWINDTYRVTTQEADRPDYVLQRINHHIFQDVELLQQNIERVTSHIRRKLTEAGQSEIDRRVLRLIPTCEGKLYYFDGESYWRMMLFIARSITHEQISEPLAYLTGKAFGDFQNMLSDIEQGALGETIPNFHNIEFRLEGLREVVARDPQGRLATAQWMVDELLARAQKMCRVQQWHRDGLIPKRVTHCDTKVNNILFDEEGRPLCVIDLDTTMPGFVLSDFGDFIRTAGNTGAEDDPDLSKVEVNMGIFRSFAKGYVESATFLTPIERENLPYGAELLTYMQTVRFLADYLDGDHYYKIQHPEHNWQRSKAQFKLLQSLEAHEQEMNDFIATL
ncbi:MAG: phosphotransferase [Alistipes sp.]|nr:phosphotransferase [Alistipes sp.]